MAFIGLWDENPLSFNNFEISSVFAYMLARKKEQKSQN
jgi:hypothetical protein